MRGNGSASARETVGLADKVYDVMVPCSASRLSVQLDWQPPKLAWICGCLCPKIEKNIRILVDALAVIKGRVAFSPRVICNPVVEFIGEATAEFYEGQSCRGVPKICAWRS